MTIAEAHTQPLDSGLYSVTEMSRYIGVRIPAPRPTLVRWIRAGLTPAGHQGGRPTHGFHDLISLLVVGWLRQEGVSLGAIREAEAYLRGETHRRRPFATERIYTDGVDVLIRANPEIRDQITAANRWGQEVMEPALGDALRGVHYENDLASWWDVEEHVRLRPGLQFGAPCVTGTRIPTAQLHSLASAGEDPEDLARLYGLRVDQVKAAIAFEQQLERVA